MISYPEKSRKIKEKYANLVFWAFADRVADDNDVIIAALDWLGSVVPNFAVSVLRGFGI